jgi:hypothetical protein
MSPSPESTEEKKPEEAKPEEIKPAEESQEQKKDQPSGVETLSAPPAVEKPKQSAVSKVLNFLFSPQTGRGRFMRALVRWVAAIVGLFALGLLVT